MRSSSLVAIAAAALPCLAQATNQYWSHPINITNVEHVNQKTRIGELAYGATNLDFNYSAGCGINFGNGTVGGGFNAGIPGNSDGSLGGGWTVTADSINFGLGAVFNKVSVNVAIVVDKKNNKLSVKVNDKEVSL